MEDGGGEKERSRDQRVSLLQAMVGSEEEHEGRIRGV